MFIIDSVSEALPRFTAVAIIRTEAGMEKVTDHQKDIIPQLYLVRVQVRSLWKGSGLGCSHLLSVDWETHKSVLGMRLTPISRGLMVKEKTTAIAVVSLKLGWIMNLILCSLLGYSTATVLFRVCVHPLMSSKERKQHWLCTQSPNTLSILADSFKLDGSIESHLNCMSDIHVAISRQPE